MNHAREIGTQFGFTVIESGGVATSASSAHMPGQCEFCGFVSELRPVGPNGERICVACGLKDPVGTSVRLAAWMEAGRPS